MKHPHEYIPRFEASLQSYIKESEGLAQVKEYKIGFDGSFGSHKITPRQLNTSFLTCLVCVEGIVTKLSLIRPKLVESVHYCPNTGKHLYREHRDPTMLAGLPTAPVYPTTDAQKNPLETEYGLSRFKDYQILNVQEMPERAPAGQLPRSVEIIVENDLVDAVKPGDRIRVMGVYKPLPSMYTSKKTKGIFQTFVLANNIQNINKEDDGPTLTPQDVLNIRSICKDPDVFNIISQSLAPSIYGHSYVKKAILLQLLGGAEKDLISSGIRLRGDINVLLVGDPGTAKSQLLRFVLHVAPLCISTTGRGASGVGLTAAVVHDKETGDRRLEAGAMVLADRGIVCIDEFDKMSSEDRVSIHEVMEQQTVTIAKAGIHASLNARCSVLAAANPIFGKYDRNRSATDNIALPDSLLSRFDLLFIILDSLDPLNDRNIADHVLRMHRYHTNDQINSFDPSSIKEDWETNPEGNNADPTSIIYLPFDKLLHTDRNVKICSIPFIKKFLLYIKSRSKPKLSEEAQNRIIDAFDELRKREDSKTLPITARTLETMIRLTIAHSKCRLSNEATAEDANVALEIMNFALYNDTSGSNNFVKLDQKNEYDEKKNPENVEPNNVSKRTKDQSDELTRQRNFEKILFQLFETNEKVPIDFLIQKVNETYPDQSYSEQEAIKILLKLEELSKIMVIDNEVLLM